MCFVISTHIWVNLTYQRSIRSSKLVEMCIRDRVKYYLYYLRKRGASDIKAKIDYPLLKKTVEVELTEEDITEIENILQEIEELVGKEVAPQLQKKSICKSCAYYELCFI